MLKTLAPLFLVAAFAFAMPLQVEAQIVAPCQGDTCTACDLVTLGQNVINFGFIAGTLISALLFAYAGVLYLTSATKSSNIQKAHGIFWNVVIGFVVLLAAWLGIDIVMKTLYGNPGPGEKWGPWNTILCRQGVDVVRTPPPSGSSSSSNGSLGNGARQLGNITTADLANAGVTLPPDIIQSQVDTLVADGLPLDEAEQEVYARLLLETGGVTINRDPCVSAAATSCTDTRYFNRATMSSILQSARDCATAHGSSCDVVITGGTELTGGHTCTALFSHCSGYKYDVRSKNVDGSPSSITGVIGALPQQGNCNNGARSGTSYGGGCWVLEDQGTPNEHWDVSIR